jgi:ABC-type transport system involved in cytochrome bd biosynthesis fused ATPase/permease subunit
MGAARVAFAAGATCAVLAIVAIGAVRAGRIGGPLAAALVLAPLALFELLAVLPDAARALDRGRAGWARLLRVADAPALIPIPAHPAPIGWTRESVLEFDRVDAAWPDSEHTVLRDTSFQVRDGEELTLTGPSGVGKSTIAALAARSLDPVAGSVRINGVDLRDTDPDDVRRVVVVCDQDSHLFDTTIAENLRIARPEADEPELWRALDAVRLEGWVRGLPDGLDTRVGQLGDAVSGGERQRLALARALLSSAPVVVLDEPTAHLDAETATAVEDNLHRELSGRTVVWIRHDPGDAPTHAVPRIGSLRTTTDPGGTRRLAGRSAAR